MSNYPMRINLLLSCISLLVLFSCKNRAVVESLPYQTNDSIFSSKGLGNRIASFSLERKAEYYIALKEKGFKNEVELDEWIYFQLRVDSFRLKELPIQKAKDLMYALDKGESTKASKFYAQYLFAFKNDPKYFPVLAVAVKETINQESNTETIKKLLPYYELGLRYDTSSYLKSGYYAELAHLHQIKGEYFKAAVNLDKAISLSRSSDTKNLSVLYQNLANMYVNMKYFEKAEYYSDIAVGLLNRSDLPLNTLNTYAVIKMRLNKLSEAESLYNEIIDKAKAKGLQMPLAMAFSNRGNVLRRKKDFEEAMKSYAASDSICKLIGVEIGVMFNKINRAEWYLDRGNTKEAENLLRSTESEIIAINNPSFNTELFRLYANVYEKLGNRSLSDHYYRKYIEIKDEVMGDQTKTIIAEWELTRERERSVEKAAAFNLEVQRERTQKLIIAITAVFMAVLGLLFYQNRRKKQELEKEHLEQEKQKLAFDLELKSKELLAESLKNVSVLNTKKDIYEDLKEIVSDLPGTQQQKFSKLMLELKSNKEQSVMDEFEARFLGVYEDFYTKLKQVAPEITPTEVRICALMRLNLSTKEIAMLTNRTVGTIDNARSKIRKRLNLAEDVNLQSYISEL